VVSQCEGLLCRFKFTFEEMEGQEMGLGQISFILPTVDGAKLLRNFISFYHSRLPRSGMAFSPRHPGSRPNGGALVGALEHDPHAWQQGGGYDAGGERRRSRSVRVFGRPLTV
jgi:hypothetical protein